MITAMYGGYPSPDAWAGLVVGVVVAVLALGCVLAWAAGRPMTRKPVTPVRFDVPCVCGKASSNCTKKEDGSCG